MKTVLKKNLIGVFALLLGIGTMSFKAWENNKPLTGSWYHVQTGGSTISTPSDPAAPTLCPGSEEVCAIEIEMIDLSTPFPSSVAEAELLADEEKLIIYGYRYRDLD